MAKTRRVVFSFDERSVESLEKIIEQGRFSSMADIVVLPRPLSKQKQGRRG